MTQAMHKNYFTFTSDSLINASVAYYAKTDDTESKGRAFFYKGAVCEELGNREQALYAYKQAEGLIPDIKDGYLISLIYEYLGIANSELGFLDKADSYYRKALVKALEIKRYNLVIANLGHIGMKHLCLNQMDSARVYYEKRLEYLSQLKDSEKAMIYHEMGTFYLTYVESKYSFAQKAIHLADASEKLRSYAVLAAHYAVSGQDELADSLWSEAMKTEDDYIRVFIFNARFLQSEQAGDYESALFYHKKFTALYDTLSVLKKSKSIAEVQAKYDVECVSRKYSNRCSSSSPFLCLLSIRHLRVKALLL